MFMNVTYTSYFRYFSKCLMFILLRVKLPYMLTNHIRFNIYSKPIRSNAKF